MDDGRRLLHGPGGFLPAWVFHYYRGMIGPVAKRKKSAWTPGSTAGARLLDLLLRGGHLGCQPDGTPAVLMVREGDTLTVPPTQSQAGRRPSAESFLMQLHYGIQLRGH